MNKREFYTVIVFIIIASLDNAAISLIPATLPSVALGVGLTQETTGLVSIAVAVVTFVTAFTSFFWGYSGDKFSRKKLMLYGTILWATCITLTTFSQNFTQLVIFQILTGIGLGCIASVGFSIIVDFVSPSNRGLVLSFWGLSQGAGVTVGYVLAVYFNTQLGWNASFWILGVITFGFIIAYFFTVEPERGATEEELQDLFSEGDTYDYKITREDLRYILGIKTNRYLILQGLFAQVGWGGLILLPTVLIFKLIAQGVPSAPANVVAPLIAGFFTFGGVFSVLFGWLGDKYQKRTYKARPIISAMGVFLGIPLIIGMLFIPFQMPGIPNTNDFGTLLGYLFGQLVSNPLFFLTFLCALLAAMFSSADSPNFFALVGDVNLPEHRGTMYGFANFINGIGRAAGLVVLPSIQLLLFTPFIVTSPSDHTFIFLQTLEWSWIWALVITLLFFILTGFCYLMTIKTAPKDIQNVKDLLADRGRTKLGD